MRSPKAVAEFGVLGRNDWSDDISRGVSRSTVALQHFDICANVWVSTLYRSRELPGMVNTQPCRTRSRPKALQSIQWVSIKLTQGRSLSEDDQTKSLIAGEEVLSKRNGLPR